MSAELIKEGTIVRIVAALGSPLEAGKRYRVKTVINLKHKENNRHELKAKWEELDQTTGKRLCRYLVY